VFPLRDINPTRVFPYVTLLLIAANALVYFFWQPNGGQLEAEFLYRHAAIACEVTTGRPLTVEEFQLGMCRPDGVGQAIFPGKAIELSLFTSMFLHGSLFHLLTNMWFLWLFGNNIEEAYGPIPFLLVYLFAGLVAAVGFIALAGVAAETGVVMLIYLDHALQARAEAARREGRALDAADLQAAIVEGAVERVRPKMMTVVAIMAGLLPIMWGTGTGSEVMSRIAAPMVGGMISSTVLTLAVIPALYALVKQWELRRRAEGGAAAVPPALAPSGEAP